MDRGGLSRKKTDERELSGQRRTEVLMRNGHTFGRELGNRSVVALQKTDVYATEPEEPSGKETPLGQSKVGTSVVGRNGSSNRRDSETRPLKRRK